MRLGAVWMDASPSLRMLRRKQDADRQTKSTLFFRLSSSPPSRGRKGMSAWLLFKGGIETTTPAKISRFFRNKALERHWEQNPHPNIHWDC